MSGSKQVGSIHIVTSLNSAKVVTGAEECRRATRAMARQMKADVTEARGSLALLGEEFGVHLPRHVRNFVASLPGVDQLAKLLPVAAVAGLGLAFVEAGKKAYEFLEKQKEAASNINEGFEKLRLSSELSNDELRVTNDRLDEQIAKLTGKRENKLKTQLDEAVVSADKLYQSLKNDNKAIADLLEKNRVNFAGFYLGHAFSGDISKRVEDLDRQDSDNVQAQKDHARTWAAQIAALGDLKRNDAERDRLTAAAKKQWDEDELQRKKQLTAAITEMETAYNKFKSLEVPGARRQTENLAISGDAGHNFQGRLDTLGETQDNRSKTATRDTAQAAVEAMRKAQQERGIIISEMLADDERYIQEQDRITAALEVTASEFFRADDEEYRRAQQLQREATEAYRQQVADKVAAMRTEREEAQQNFQELSEQLGIRVQMGQESSGDRIKELQAAAAVEYQSRADSLDQEISIYVTGTKEYEAALRERHKLDADYYKQQADLQRQASEVGIDGAINDIIRRSADMASQVKQELESALDSVNEQFGKLMSGQYHRGDWTKAGQSVFAGISKTALQDGEGALLKGLHLGGAGKLGTQGNPMWTKSADLAGAGMGSLASGLMSSGSSGSSAAGNGVGSLVSAVLGSIIPMASGGQMYPGEYYLTGEQGPELVQFGQGGKIHNAVETRSMLGKNGGGDTVHHHHNYTVDARGAHDPAAVDAAVQRGIRKAAPHLIAASASYQADMRSRKPTGMA